MADGITGETIRQTLLEVIDEYSKKGPSLQSGVVLREVQMRLRIGRDLDAQQGLLTFLHDLFRMGYLAWGYDLSNPAPPFCHLTRQGRLALEHVSRDPANPDGYLAHVRAVAQLDPVTESYLTEALNTYNAACHKATAVLVGAAAESVILDLRDAFVRRMASTGVPCPRDLQDWKPKTILDALKLLIDARKQDIPRKTFDSYEAFWQAFVQQIRTARNDAGHPTSIDPVSPETVHACLLMLPDLFRLSKELKDWASGASLS